MANAYHTPVLLQESVDALNIKPDGVYVDVTFGGGGHSRAILERLDEEGVGEGSLIAFDQDADAARNVPVDDRFQLVASNFRHLKRFMRLYAPNGADGLLADLGVSSHQFDTAGRGFSFRFEGELDMRMDTNQTTTARTVIDTYSTEDLQRIFSEYGEVRNAKTLAQTIVDVRALRHIITTQDFAHAIEPCIRGERNTYLAQVYQALRMEVNDELGALSDMLDQAYEVLVPGARLVVLTYHSLEDRIVKQHMKGILDEDSDAVNIYGQKEFKWKVISKKPITPSAEELKANPRSRSAKLRIAEKL